MRCKFCGTTLPDHAKFCPGCGKEIDNDRERHEGREASNIPEDAYYTLFDRCFDRRFLSLQDGIS